MTARQIAEAVRVLKTLHRYAPRCPGCRTSAWTPTSARPRSSACSPQRLVGEICWNCKHEYTPPESLLYEVFDLPPSGLTYYRGLGCAACHHTGYRGRIALVELWRPSDEDVRLINQRAPFDDIRASAERNTLCMADDALVRLRESQIRAIL